MPTPLVLAALRRNVPPSVAMNPVAVNPGAINWIDRIPTDDGSNQGLVALKAFLHSAISHNDVASLQAIYVLLSPLVWHATAYKTWAPSFTAILSGVCDQILAALHALGATWPPGVPSSPGSSVGAAVGQLFLKPSVRLSAMNGLSQSSPSAVRAAAKSILTGNTSDEAVDAALRLCAYAEWMDATKMTFEQALATLGDGAISSYYKGGPLLPDSKPAPIAAQIKAFLAVQGPPQISDLLLPMDALIARYHALQAWDRWPFYQMLKGHESYDPTFTDTVQSARTGISKDAQWVDQTAEWVRANVDGSAFRFDLLINLLWRAYVALIRWKYQKILPACAQPEAPTGFGDGTSVSLPSSNPYAGFQMASTQPRFPPMMNPAIRYRGR